MSGRVHGVWFRASARDEALRRQVRGWVRNLADGRVEAVFVGDEDQVRAMVDWCRQGPPSARVDDVEVQWEPCPDPGDDAAEEAQEERGFVVR